MSSCLVCERLLLTVCCHGQVSGSSGGIWEGASQGSRKPQTQVLPPLPAGLHQQLHHPQVRHVAIEKPANCFLLKQQFEHFPEERVKFFLIEVCFRPAPGGGGSGRPSRACSSSSRAAPPAASVGLLPTLWRLWTGL